MKPIIFASVLGVLGAAGCSHMHDSTLPLSVTEAIPKAQAGEGREVVVAGYYQYHFEGDALWQNWGDMTEGSGIMIQWRVWPTLKEQNLSGRFVEIAGILRRKTVRTMGHDKVDVPVLEGVSIREAAHTAGPGSPSQTGSP